MTASKNCVNCGKQNLFDADSKPTDKCFSCGKPIGIKESEVTTVHQVDKVDTEKPPFPEIYVASGEKRQVKRPGLYKWRKRCKDCEFHYFHDETTWCSIQKCPQRCPPRLRPQYRPKLEPPGQAKREKKAAPAAAAPKNVPGDFDVAAEVCVGCPVLQVFKGYRLAVNDILGTLKKPKGGR